MSEFHMVGQRALWVNIHHTAGKAWNSLHRGQPYHISSCPWDLRWTLVRCTRGELECERIVSGMGWVDGHIVMQWLYVQIAVILYKRHLLHCARLPCLCAVSVGSYILVIDGIMPSMTSTIWLGWLFFSIIIGSIGTAMPSSSRPWTVASNSHSAETLVRRYVWKSFLHFRFSHWNENLESSPTTTVVVGEFPREGAEPCV